MHQVIVDSITNKRCLSFTYDGFPRTVEPHTYGLSRKDEEVLRAYQIGGGHASGHFEPWHLFSISKMFGLTMADSTFSGPRSGYRRGDNHIPTIYAQL